MKPSPVDPLLKKLKRFMPQTEISLDPPSLEDGVWTADIRFQRRWVVLEYYQKRDKPFGLSRMDNKSDVGYGEGPDEVFQTEEETFDHILDHLT